ncbi:MAG: EAL domain-containing protein [Rhodocyclaceae bacterium]|nr:EAL domain-containing protein [Rhodocyclaceae bacterium]
MSGGAFVGAVLRTLAAGLAVISVPGLAMAAASDRDHVLAIFSGHRDSPAERLIEDGLRDAFEAASTGRGVRLSTLYLDMFSAYDEAGAAASAARLRQRLAVRGDPDAIVTVAEPAARFLADYRALLPEASPVAMLGAYPVGKALAGPNTRTFEVEIAVAETLRQALQLFPDTRSVLVIAGDGAQDRHDLEVARRQLAMPIAGIDLEFVTGFDAESLIARAGRLPSDALLLMTAVTRDAEGRILMPPSAYADRLARNSSVPTFCVYEGTVRNAACVGGMVTAGRDTGQRLGSYVVAMIDDDAPADAVVRLPAHGLFKGSALRRWGLGDDGLVAGSTVIDAKLGVYQRYKALIWGGLGVIAAQGLSIVALVVALRNSRRHRTRLRELQQRWAFALESAGHGVWDWDIAGRQHFFSRGWRGLLGTDDHGSRDRKHCRDLLIHGDDRPEVDARLAVVLDTDAEQYHSEHRMQHTDGHMLWVVERGRVVARGGDGRPLRLVATLEDVTARRAAAAQIEYLATHDALTGLPNRTLLADRIERAISRARREDHKVAVIFLDLDHFKQVNDTLGHHIGDLLLVAVAGRLMPHLRESDTVSRQGGDEFVVLLPELAEPGDAALVCDKLMQELADPVQFDGHELRISASMGVAIFPDDGRDRETLLQKADVALYRAKDSGRRGYRFFSAEMNAELNDLIALDSRLAAALSNGRLSLWYQPQFDLASGELCGAEALMRWIEDDGESIPPSRFIAVAEQFGHIHELGEFALRTACREARRWQTAFNRAIPVAVNLSAVQFGRAGLSELLERILTETGLPPFLLTLEITESVIMEDEHQTQQTLRALAATGARLAIDDFGTGYSSLAYLKRFPVHHLKIDRAFVKDLGRDPDDEVIVRTIVQLGHSLGLQIVAEGVETDEQSRILMRHGCDFAQGFLYGRPQPAEAFRQRLSETHAIGS